MEFSSTFTDLILAPLIAFLIPIMWKLANIPIAAAREYFMKANSLVEIPLAINIDNQLFTNATFKCLLVRFGTDQYIKEMASDQEKYDGRLRNTIIEGNYTTKLVSYNIPLHKRIGTQFKCYLEVPTKEEAEAILENAENFESIYDLGYSSSHEKNRIFFLLKSYGTTQTVDGFHNNLIMPI